MISEWSQRPVNESSTCNHSLLQLFYLVGQSLIRSKNCMVFFRSHVRESGHVDPRRRRQWMHAVHPISCKSAQWRCSQRMTRTQVPLENTRTYSQVPLLAILSGWCRLVRKTKELWTPHPLGILPDHSWNKILVTPMLQTVILCMLHNSYPCLFQLQIWSLSAFCHPPILMSKLYKVLKWTLHVKKLSKGHASVFYVYMPFTFSYSCFPLRTRTVLIALLDSFCF